MDIRQSDKMSTNEIIKRILVGNPWNYEQHFLNSTDTIIDRNFNNNQNIFHISLNHEATKSALTQDKILCKNKYDPFSNSWQQNFLK